MRDFELRFTAGILLCGRVRDLLEEIRWSGRDIIWREGRGWIDRKWTIRGNRNDLERVKAYVLIFQRPRQASWFEVKERVFICLVAFVVIIVATALVLIHFSK